MIEKILGAAVHMSEDDDRAVVLIRGEDFYGKIELIGGKGTIFKYTKLDKSNYISSLENIERPFLMSGGD